MILHQPLPIVNNMTDFITPLMAGALDAEQGYPFCPEAYYAKACHMLEYTEGFVSVRGECFITRSFKVSILGVDVEAELEDLQSDMADREFWASGNW